MSFLLIDLYYILDMPLCIRGCAWGLPTGHVGGRGMDDLASVASVLVWGRGRRGYGRGITTESSVSSGYTGGS